MRSIVKSLGLRLFIIAVSVFELAAKTPPLPPTKADLSVAKLAAERASVLRSRHEADLERLRLSEIIAAKRRLCQPTTAEVARCEQIQKDQLVRARRISELTTRMAQLETAQRQAVIQQQVKAHSAKSSPSSRGAPKD